MNRVRKIMESRFAEMFCLAIAIANRIVFTSLYSTIGRDTMVQLTHAENLMAGKGLGATKYFIADLDRPVFDTYQLFPPGYSFSIIPFLKLFNNDLYKAVFAHDIISALLFIAAVRFVGKRIGLSVLYLNMVTIIAGCSQYIFFTSGSATDAIGVSLLLFAFGITIRIIEQRKQHSLLQIIWFGIILFLPSFYRFMYIPITALLPIGIFWAGLFEKNKMLRNTGLRIGIFVLFLLALQPGIAMYNNADIGHTLHGARGFFPEQITRWYPFIPASFINLDFAAQQFSKVLGSDYSTMMLAFEVINMILFFILLYLLGYFIFKQKKRSLLSAHSNFIIIGAAISITSLLVLVYPTLTYKIDEEYGRYSWTYIYDSRYYAFFYCFIPLLFFLIPSFITGFFQNKIRRFVWLAGLLLFMAEALHGIYYNTKILAGDEDIEVIRNRDEDYRAFSSVVFDLKRKYPHREIIVSATDQVYLHKASLTGYKAMFDYKNLNKLDPVVTESAVLLLAVSAGDHHLVKVYLEKNKPDLFKNIAGTSFYIEELNPR